MKSNDIIVDMKNVTKSYDREVLKDISLEVKGSDYYAICGKSGAGKSTLMNILGLIENYTSGEYYFCGSLIKKNKDYSRFRLKHIGFIFQSYNLIPTLTCKENILLPSLYAEADKKFIDDRLEYLVEKMDLSVLLNQKSSILSGGEKQRVAIARALLLDPKIIIADEPTGNLDPVNKQIVMDTLNEEHNNGRAIVMITHDMETAKLADKILILKDGKIDAQ